ncbi:stalk domain-containing protein [Paenibacillus sp. 2RAB27]|uniref:stalk domain-containing protein n=1 Tax=Paenibacillus sp. 2RAB27 TaxID=3232991 RepID=UPI003F9BBEB3
MKAIRMRVLALAGAVVLSNSLLSGGVVEAKSSDVSILAANSAKAAYQKVKVTINGVDMIFKQQDALLINGATMVPMREIFEKLGAEIGWNPQTQTVTATKDSTVIVLQIGAKTATVNGKTVQLAKEATVINNATLVPLRFVSEALGATIKWDAATGTALIESRSQAALLQILKDRNEYFKGKYSKLSIDDHTMKVDYYGVFGDGYYGLYVQLTEAQDLGALMELLKSDDSTVHRLTKQIAYDIHDKFGEDLFLIFIQTKVNVVPQLAGSPVAPFNPQDYDIVRVLPDGSSDLINNLFVNRYDFINRRVDSILVHAPDGADPGIFFRESLDEDINMRK